MTTICEYCESSIIKSNLSKHQKSEICNKIKLLLINKKNKYELQLKILEDNNKILEVLALHQSDKIKLLTEENTSLKTEIKILEKASEGYRKIVEKAATKSTNTINKNYQHKNYQHNNYLNYISSEPINFSNLKKQLKDVVTAKSIMYDDEDFHKHIVDNILKDKDGKDKLLCTDINRKNFTYKDEKSGELISDPELEKLREQLKKGTDIKLLRRNLLEKLVNEYEKNGNVGTDPYKIFSEIIFKLNFGSPFVEHVAKKTYIKTKNSEDGQILQILDEQKEEIIDEDEDEYQKLYEEFGEENE